MLLQFARLKHNGDYKDPNPLVSVRIPTLNRAELLMARAVNSVLWQTYRNFEIVIVGDNCTDRTEELLRKQFPMGSRPICIWYNLPPRSQKEQELLKDPEIRWFIGPVRATNVATKLCSGKWIAHIDDDDIWTGDHIEELLKFALQGNYEFVSADYIAEKYGKEEVKSGGCQTWLYRKYVADIFQYNPDCWKNKWNRVSDTDVYDRMKKAGIRMGHLNKVVAYIVPRPGEDTIGLESYKKYDAIH